MKYELVEANGQYGVRQITGQSLAFMYDMSENPIQRWWHSPEFHVLYCFTPNRQRAEDIFAKLEPKVIATKEPA